MRPAAGALPRLHQVVADVVWKSCSGGQGAVSGGIYEIVGQEPEPPLGALLDTLHPHNPVALHPQVKKLGVQEEFQVLLAHDRIQQGLAPEDGVAVRIAVEVLQLQSAPDAHLLGKQVSRTGGAPGPHPDFAAGVAAQHRAIPHQHGINPQAGCRQRGADSGRAAAGHHQTLSDLLHTLPPYFYSAEFILKILHKNSAGFFSHSFAHSLVVDFVHIFNNFVRSISDFFPVSP